MKDTMHLSALRAITLAYGVVGGEWKLGVKVRGLGQSHDTKQNLLLPSPLPLTPLPPPRPLSQLPALEGRHKNKHEKENSKD